MTAGAPTLVRRSLSDQTARLLRELILNGTLRPGQKLTETELATSYGVSSSVIREALQLLQAEGIIVNRPYCGRTVFELQPKEASELLVTRASLESYAAYLAAKKITSAHAETIQSAAGRMLEAPPTTYSGWVELELGFHGAVWNASGNDWLVRYLNQLWLPIFAHTLVSAPRAEGFDMHELWQDSQLREKPGNPAGHQALAAAICQGDAVAAKNMMLTHVLHIPSGREPLSEFFGL